MKKVNIPLLLGLILLIGLILISLFPDLFITSDPYAVEVMSVQKDGTAIFPPFAPGVKGILGTDEIGRDIFSQLIVGAHLTLKIVIICLLILLSTAFPLGLRAGLGGGISKWIVHMMNTLFTAIPALIFCIIILKLPPFGGLSTEFSIFAFAIIIAIVEMGRVGVMIQQKVLEIIDQPFIEGQVVIGKSKCQIGLQNVIPHLIPYIVVLLALEASRILMFVCQLGIFGAVLGNLTFDKETYESLGRNVTYEPEWAAMVGTSINNFRSAPWIVFTPIIAFFMAILSFNLVGEGLRTEFDKKNSRLISWIKRIPYHTSPKVYLYDMKKIKVKPWPGITKTVILVGVLIVIFFPRQIFYQPFEAKEAIKHIEMLCSDNFSGRRSGTVGRDKAAEYIKMKLKEAGIKPAGSQGFEYPFKLQDSRMNVEESISISLDGGEWNNLKPYIDFNITNFGNVSYKGGIGKNSTINNSITTTDFLILDGNSDELDYLYTEITAASKKQIPKFIFLISEDMNQKAIYQEMDFMRDKPFPIVKIGRKLGNSILKANKFEINIDIRSSSTSSQQGKHILGVIPGTDPKLKDQFVVIGSDYDGVGFNNGIAFQGAMDNASSVALNLETARALMKKGSPRRTVIFAFWDYSGRSPSGASFMSTFPTVRDTKDSLYIDLKYLGLANGKKLVLDTTKNDSSMPDSQRLGKYLKNALKNMGFNLHYDKIESEEAFAMDRRGLSCIVVKSDGADPIVGTSNDKIEIIDYKTYKDIGQGMVNALVKMLN